MGREQVARRPHRGPQGGRGVRRGGHPPAGSRRQQLRGQALRRPVLRRVLDPHVQQGGPGQGRRHADGEPDLAGGRRRGEEGQDRGHGRHLHARQAGLGRPLRSADDGRADLRRQLVRPGLERHGQHPGVEGGRHLLQDDARRVRAGRPRLLQLQRVPDRAQGGQGRDVGRRLGRSLHARGRRLPGEGQDGLRPHAGQQDRPSPAGCGAGTSRSRHPRRTRMPRSSSSSGPRARSTTSSSARRSAGATSRRAPAPRPTRSPSTRRPPRPSPPSPST